jgi:putative membrane protein
VRFLTVGLFTLVINGFLLLLASKVAPGFVIDGYWTAFWAAIAYSLVTWLGGQIFLRDAD